MIKISLKMLLHTIALNLIVSLIWAAPLSSGNDQNKETSMSYKQKLCSKTPTVNISEVCSTPKELAGVASNFSTFNGCDRSLYLLQEICTKLYLNSNLTKKAEKDIDVIFKTKMTDEKESFCDGMLRNQTKLGCTSKFDFGPYDCKDFCITRTDETFVVNPLCNFMLWSWNFLKDSTKGDDKSIACTPLVATAGPNDGEKPLTNQVPENSTSFKSSVQEVVPGPSALQDSDHPDVKTDESPTQQIQVTNSRSQEANLEGNIPKENEKGGETVQKLPKNGEGSENILEEVGPKPALPSTPKTGVAEIVESSSKLEENSNTFNENTADNTMAKPEIQAAVNPPPAQPQKPQASRKPDKDIEKKPQNSDMDLNESNPHDVDDDAADNDGDPHENLPSQPEEENYKPEIEKKNTYGLPKETVSSSADDFNETEDSHFFVFFVIASFVCILFYFIYQNKRKIIAMALEGKKGRHSGRRRPTSASYQKLDNKLDEVMASSPPPSKSHVIY